MLRRHGKRPRSSNMIIRRKNSPDTTSFALTLLALSIILYLYSTHVFNNSQVPLRDPPARSSKDRSPTHSSRSLFLNHEECNIAFPGLTKPVDDAVSRGPFKLKKKPGDYPGLVQGRIRNGKVGLSIVWFYATIAGIYG